MDSKKLTDEELIELVAQSLRPKEKAIPFLREMLQLYGRDKFMLRYGIRKPRDKGEEIKSKFWRGEISEEEFKSEMEEYATRSVDPEMLNALEEDIEASLGSYSGFLQSVIEAANICDRKHDIYAGRSLERRADGYCKLLECKSKMYSDELINCGAFLEEMNTIDGKGVITVEEFTGTTAFWITTQVVQRAIAVWMSCRKIASRSQRGFEYTHAVSASCVFRETYAEKLPQPQLLHTLISEELSRARLRLQRMQEEPKAEESNSGDQEPRLTELEYQQILDVMQNMALVMERSPSAFRTMDEETLRTHFLVQLNGQWAGQATGETFNYEGKTDILVRSQGRNIFIAECKFWTGAKSLTDAIDQLLSYSTWRDTKLAIVIFNRNRDFTKVLTTADETAKNHPNCKRDLGKQTETTFRYIVSHKDDENRELMLTIMAFNMPV